MGVVGEPSEELLGIVLLGSPCRSVTVTTPVRTAKHGVLGSGVVLYGRAMAERESVTEWLLDSDPSIRWQVMRDLVASPESEWRAERARVGWGARLLSRVTTQEPS